MTRDEILNALWQAALSRLWHDADENSDEYKHAQRRLYEEWQKILWPVKRNSSVDANGNRPSVVKLIKTLAQKGEAYTTKATRAALPLKYERFVWSEDGPHNEGRGTFSYVEDRNMFCKLAHEDGYFTPTQENGR